MSIKERLLKTSKILFLILVFLIPLNLGKHFEIIGSYVWGVLIDYLIPTIYIQDILAFFILLLWSLGGGVKKIKERSINLLERREIQISFMLVFSLLLSTLSAERFVPSIYAWLRLLLYFFIFIYILVEIPVEDYFFKILNILGTSLFLLSVLAIAQYIKKGSVFDSYLVLGEQPYSISTFEVARKEFLGRVVLPAYGLFRHPNIFGGYLSLVLIWLLSFIKKNRFYLLFFLLGCVALFLTFSYISWLVFLFGILVNFYFSHNPKKIKYRKYVAVTLVSIFSIIMILLPFVDGLSESSNLSISRRTNFSRASYRMIRDFPIFGVGLNNSTVLMDEYNYETRDIRFTQPVHNIFLLIFSEAGVFSFILFAVFFYFCGKKLINSSYFHLYLISFLQILLLGSFDHYIFTIHQTFLLFWVILALAIQ